MRCIKAIGKHSCCIVFCQALPHGVNLWAVFQNCKQADVVLTATTAICWHALQAPSQRAAAAVSLSHADPVVQPTQSSAGAVGTSANPT